MNNFRIWVTKYKEIINRKSEPNENSSVFTRLLHKKMVN